MASLNLSLNGPSINSSYQSVVNASLPTGSTASSSTYALWALFSVSAPLASAFALDNTNKESVLKVQSTGEGELLDLIEDFSDGKIQFAFAKVKDPNSGLPKFVLIGWCGEGVPERTKGYFTSHLAAVSKTLHGYHVQVTARSDRDLTPDTIVQKVSDASGSKYAPKSTASIAPAPPLSSKPVYTPTNSSTGVAGSNTFAAQSRLGPSQVSDVDEDGWGADAPPVTRTSLEKVQASYEPTKINAGGFAPGGRSNDHHEKAIKTNESSAADVVRGGYQPVGKVDIAQIRAQSQRDGANDKAAPVKGAYEPVGKVDIAAIRAKAQRSTADESSTSSQLASHTESRTSLPDRSMPLHGSERLTALPKPKVASRFGSNAPSFVGTKAPAPGGFQSGVAMPTASTAQLGVGRTFADEGGKTPAQMWAEKKARDRGLSAGSESLESPVPSQNAQATASRGPDMTEWKSGYSGKSWAPVQTARTGQSSASTGESNPARNQETAEDTETAQSGSVGAIRHKLSGTSPSGAANIEEPASRMFPPALDMSNKPNAGQFSPITSSPLGPTETGTLQEPEARMPTPPPHPPRSPTPPTPPAVTGSPIRVAMPVSRGSGEPSVTAAHDEMMPQTAMPVKSLSEVVPKEDDISGDAGGNQDTGRRVAETMATGLEGESALPSQDRSELSALVQFDYEKAEDNELELREGEHVTAIETVDENWWMGQNARGESGLFPSNYVELIQSEEGISHDGEPSRAAQEDSQGPTATALYDYEAAEENELSFPEGATIQDIEFPDEDWWSGCYEGKEGLFPANYVRLDN